MRNILFFFIFMIAILAKEQESLQVDPCTLRSFQYGLLEEKWCEESWQEEIKARLNKRFSFPQLGQSARYMLGSCLSQRSEWEIEVETGNKKIPGRLVVLKLSIFLNDRESKSDVMNKILYGYAAEFERQKGLQEAQEKAWKRAAGRTARSIIEFLKDFESPQGEREETEERNYQIMLDYNNQDYEKTEKEWKKSRIKILRENTKKNFFTQVQRMLGEPEASAWEVKIKPGKAQEGIHLVYKSQKAGFAYLFNITQNEITMILPMACYIKNILQKNKEYHYPAPEEDFPFSELQAEKKEEWFVLLVSQERIQFLEKLLEKAIEKAQEDQKKGKNFISFLPITLYEWEKLGQELLSHNWSYGMALYKNECINNQN
ncbi:MAG: hypothetical protein HUU50_12385 [Candidatus Brocadiae bacterium]|nr:hypothetical protein [Candidatus Brocadiia bacterium]